MAETWSPEDEEGFGIRGADKDALTEEQQKALDDLRVQTARDNQKYLHDHPEVKAMLSLLIRETLLQERDVRSVAGELFCSEKRVVAAVRRMLGMEPMPPRKKRGSDEDDTCQSPVREVTFSENSVRRGRQLDVPLDEPRMKRRDTPAPWIEHQLLKLSDTAYERASQEAETWVQEELGRMADSVGGGSSLGAEVLSGMSGSLSRDGITGDDVGEGEEEEEIPLGRRDTPAPWSFEPVTISEQRGKEKYVLGLLEKILEEPADSKDGHDVFDKLDKILEEEE